MSEGRVSAPDPNVEKQNAEDGGAKNKAVNKNANDKKGKKEKKDYKVVYMTVEEEDDPIYIKIKRLILKLIDEYVMTYKKPIRRKKLKELVFTNDEKLMRMYEEEKEVAVGIFNYALISLLRDGKVLKVKDPEKKRFSYFILPKHLEMFKDYLRAEQDQGSSNGG